MIWGGGGEEGEGEEMMATRHSTYCVKSIKDEEEAGISNKHLHQHFTTSICDNTVTAAVVAVAVVVAAVVAADNVSMMQTLSAASARIWLR